MSDSLPFPLQADPASGALESEGQPVIVIPRRFFVFLQMEAEKRLGMAGAAELFGGEATRKAARVWCEQHEAVTGRSPREVVADYLDRVSRRGMGQFTIARLSMEEGVAEVRLAHSIFVAEYGTEAGRSVCYSFAAALAGAMEYLRLRAGAATTNASAHECECRANGGASCRFEITFY